MITDNIKFERYLHHTRSAGMGLKQPMPVYYFKVIIDGDHRATLHRDFGDGYRLHDADGRTIEGEGYSGHLGALVKKKEDFFQFIQDHMPKIPTLARMAELRVEEAEYEKQLEVEARRRLREHRTKQHAIELMAMLKELTGYSKYTGIAFAEAMNSALLLVEKAEDIGEGSDNEFFKDRLESEMHSLKYHERWKPGKD